jgi:hypothetical protein
MRDATVRSDVRSTLLIAECSSPPGCPLAQLEDPVPLAPRDAIPTAAGALSRQGLFTPQRLRLPQ